jgi:rfaE bifunctional protein kinase chain/domain
LEVLPRFAGKRILVVGDLFLDEYLVGRPTRISREAPVLVLEFEKRFCLPGGGTNPARNLQALGVEAHMVGIVGKDDGGAELRKLLGAAGICTEGVVVDPSRPTITKTRILAQDGSIVRQQVVRVDRLSREPLMRETTSRLISYLEDQIDRIDAILLSDYKSGVVTDELIDACRDLTTSHNKLLTVDSQGDLYRFRGFGLVKSNQAEAEATLGVSLDSEDSFRFACERLLADLGACVVVITRGGSGLSIMEAGGPHIHIPVANRSEVFDVVGAGDTAIAVLTVALVAGARPVVAAHLANYAAGLVVRKVGNATTSIEELREAITTSQFPRVDPDQDFLK